MNDELNIPHCIKNWGADSYPVENGFLQEEESLERVMLSSMVVVPSKVLLLRH